MKTAIFIIMLGMVPLLGRAQIEISYDSLTDIHCYQYQAQQYDYQVNNQQSSYHTVAIKGSAYLYNSFQPGTVPLQNNRSISVPLNYNITEDYLLVNLPDGQKAIYPESFTINDRAFFRLNNQYYEALYLGKIKLLRRYTARLDKIERNGYNEHLKYDYEYSKGNDLFLYQQDGSIDPVRLSEKSLLSKLSDYKEARTIVREQNLNLRTEKGVIALLNSLER